MRKVPTAKLPGAPTLAQRQREYNRNRRDKEATRFYHLAAWLKVRDIKLCDAPWCEDCLSRGVHTQQPRCTIGSNGANGRTLPWTWTTWSVAVPLAMCESTRRHRGERSA